MPDADGAPEVPVQLDQEPNLTWLLARAAATGWRRSGTRLPTTRLARDGVRIDRDRLAAYTRVCGFTLSDTLPPTYLHLRAFPLSVQLMAGRSFPFAMAGLVHVRNRLTVHRPVTATETVDVAVHLAGLRPHPKGRQFDVCAEVGVAGEPVWSSRSTYLARGTGGADGAGGTDGADETGRDAEDAAGAAAVDPGQLPTTARWRVGSDIGRRYAAVSGDRNPIHLSSLSARAFGFPSAIAHGMWTTARALAGLEGTLPEAVEVDVVFKKPVLLPATVEYATAGDEHGWRFALRRRSGVPHLIGVATPV